MIGNDTLSRRPASPADYTHKVRYILIFAIILAALTIVVLVRGLQQHIDDRPVPTQRSTNSTNRGTTNNTGAPTTDTNTPVDRTVPSTSGGESNSLLRPQ